MTDPSFCMFSPRHSRAPRARVAESRSHSRGSRTISFSFGPGDTETSGYPPGSERGDSHTEDDSDDWTDSQEGSGYGSGQVLPGQSQQLSCQLQRHHHYFSEEGDGNGSSSPSPKRRRLNTSGSGMVPSTSSSPSSNFAPTDPLTFPTRPAFDHLPPDVIVEEILPHHVLILTKSVCCGSLPSPSMSVFVVGDTEEEGEEEEDEDEDEESDEEGDSETTGDVRVPPRPTRPPEGIGGLKSLSDERLGFGLRLGSGWSSVEDELGCFGYFKRDGLRYPWAVFRSVEVRIADVYVGGGGGKQSESGKTAMDVDLEEEDDDDDEWMEDVGEEGEDVPQRRRWRCYLPPNTPKKESEMGHTGFVIPIAYMKRLGLYGWDLITGPRPERKLRAVTEALARMSFPKLLSLSICGYGGLPDWAETILTTPRFCPRLERLSIRDCLGWKSSPAPLPSAQEELRGRIVEVRNLRSVEFLEISGTMLPLDLILNGLPEPKGIGLRTLVLNSLQDLPGSFSSSEFVDLRTLVLRCSHGWDQSCTMDPKPCTFPSLVSFSIDFREIEHSYLVCDVLACWSMPKLLNLKIAHIVECENFFNGCGNGCGGASFSSSLKRLVLVQCDFGDQMKGRSWSRLERLTVKYVENLPMFFDSSSFMKLKRMVVCHPHRIGTISAPGITEMKFDLCVFDESTFADSRELSSVRKLVAKRVVGLDFLFENPDALRCLRVCQLSSVEEFQISTLFALQRLQILTISGLDWTTDGLLVGECRSLTRLEIVGCAGLKGSWSLCFPNVKDVTFFCVDIGDGPFSNPGVFPKVSEIHVHNARVTGIGWSPKPHLEVLELFGCPLVEKLFQRHQPPLFPRLQKLSVMNPEGARVTGFGWSPKPFLEVLELVGCPLVEELFQRHQPPLFPRLRKLSVMCPDRKTLVGTKWDAFVMNLTRFKTDLTNLKLMSAIRRRNPRCVVDHPKTC